MHVCSSHYTTLSSKLDSVRSYQGEKMTNRRPGDDSSQLKLSDYTWNLKGLAYCSTSLGHFTVLAQYRSSRKDHIWMSVWLLHSIEQILVLSKMQVTANSNPLLLFPKLNVWIEILKTDGHTSSRTASGTKQAARRERRNKSRAKSCTFQISGSCSPGACSSRAGSASRSYAPAHHVHAQIDQHIPRINSQRRTTASKGARYLLAVLRIPM